MVIFSRDGLLFIARNGGTNGNNASGDGLQTGMMLSYCSFACCKITRANLGANDMILDEVNTSTTAFFNGSRQIKTFLLILYGFPIVTFGIGKMITRKFLVQPEQLMLVYQMPLMNLTSMPSDAVLILLMVLLLFMRYNITNVDLAAYAVLLELVIPLSRRSLWATF